MSLSKWLRYTPHVLVGAAVFAFMHVADEMAGAWDAGAAGQPLGDPTSASLSLGVFTLIAMGALWLLLTDRPWGYLLGLLFGVQFAVTGEMHFVNTAEMTGFRWVVVALEVAFAVALVALSLEGLWVRKPWSGSEGTTAA